MLPLNDNWGQVWQNRDSHLGFRINSGQEFLLENLTIPYRFVKISYFNRNPFHISNENSSQSWSEEGAQLQLIVPFFWKHNRFFFKADVMESQSDIHFNSVKKESYFHLADNLNYNSFALAHRWEKLRVRWAAQFRVVHFGGKGLVEPTWALEWGEESTTKFLIELGKHNLHNTISWKLQDDSLNTGFYDSYESAKLALKFGDHRGINITLFLLDEYHNPPAFTPPTKMQIHFNGVKRMIGLEVSRTSERKLNGSIGLISSGLDGDILLEKDANKIGEIPNLIFAQNTLYAELSYFILRGWRIVLGNSWSICESASDVGNISASLPDAFTDVIGGERLFIYDVKGTSNITRLSSTYRRKFITIGNELGYADITPDFLLQDAARNSQVIRKTEWGLERFGLLWGTLDLRTSFLGWQFGMNYSKQFPVWKRYKHSSPVGESTFKKGDLLTFSLSHKF